MSFGNGNGEQARDYIQFCIFSGLRRREVTGITWKDCDKDRNVIWIGKNKSKRGGYNIPYTPVLKEILNRRTDYKPFDFDEPDKMFAWITKQTLGKTTTMRKYGIKDGIAVSSHDLRRSFATYAKNSEVAISPAMLKALLNHSLAGDVTDEHYDQSHKDPKQRMKAAIKIQEFILSKAKRLKAEAISMENRRA